MHLDIFVDHLPVILFLSPLYDAAGPDELFALLLPCLSSFWSRSSSWVNSRNRVVTALATFLDFIGGGQVQQVFVSAFDAFFSVAFAAPSYVPLAASM